jgi:hypothetical protein
LASSSVAQGMSNHSTSPSDFGSGRVVDTNQAVISAPKTKGPQTAGHQKTLLC